MQRAILNGKLLFYFSSGNLRDSARSGFTISVLKRLQVKRQDRHDVLRRACHLRAHLGQRELLGHPTLRRSLPTQLRRTALTHLFRDSFVRARAAPPPPPLGGHDVPEGPKRSRPLSSSTARLTCWRFT